MNIIIITGGYPTPKDPANHSFLDQLACEWADMGVHITVIYPVPRFVAFQGKNRFYKSDWVRKTPRLKEVHIICPRYMGTSNRKLFGINTKEISYLGIQKAILNVLENIDEKPDFIYSHFLSSGCHAGDLGKKLGIPSYCAFGESSLWSVENRNKKRVKESLNSLNGIISVSSVNKKILIEEGFAEEENVIVLPNGVNHELFFPREKRDIRNKLNLPNDVFIGVYVGAFNDSKGVLRAQKAAENAENTKMIFVGSGKLIPEGNNILFSGRLPHELIPEYLSAADFFILPTRAEGCCNAIVEALACGLPIISSDREYNADILKEDYSFQINPDDIKAMSDAIGILRHNIQKRNIMAQKAYKASKDFDIHKRAEAIIDFMKKKA